MAIIDAQVHAYEANHPGRPWVGTIPGPEHVTGEELVAAMDGVGVDGGLLVSPWTLYRGDPSYAVEVFKAHPTRFRLVAPINPFADGVKETVESWVDTPGAVGIRIMISGDTDFEADHPSVVTAVTTAEKAGLATFVQCWGKLQLLEELARQFPTAQFVLDHLGITQPIYPPGIAEPWGDLPRVLQAANFPNVAIKVTGACTLSHKPFPFDDLWEPVGRVIEAFGVDRCMWGTDWTRATALVTYHDAVAAFRDHWPISAAERNALMGGTLQRLLRWSM